VDRLTERWTSLQRELHESLAHETDSSATTSIFSYHPDYFPVSSTKGALWWALSRDTNEPEDTDSPAVTHSMHTVINFGVGHQ